MIGSFQEELAHSQKCFILQLMPELSTSLCLKGQSHIMRLLSNKEIDKFGTLSRVLDSSQSDSFFMRVCLCKIRTLIFFVGKSLMKKSMTV